MQALSIAMRKTTPGQPMALYRSSAKLTSASSIPSSGPPPFGLSTKYKRGYVQDGSARLTVAVLTSKVSANHD